MLNNFSKKILLAALVSSTFYNVSMAISKEEEAGIKNTLNGISKTLSGVVDKAEKLYITNRGASGNSSFQSVLDGTSGNYFKSIEITSNFNIRLTFQGSDISSGSLNLPGVPAGTSIRTPIPRQLQNKRILLIAIYGQNDSQISYWQCITDADANSDNFVSSNASTLSSKTLSLIAYYSGDSDSGVYLGSCYYVSTSEFNTLWTNTN